jgi:hypothetical protein
MRCLSKLKMAHICLFPFLVVRLDLMKKITVRATLSYVAYWQHSKNLGRLLLVAHMKSL